jgi:hypothetical protein
VKYVARSSFLADFKRLSPRERALFMDAVAAMNAAYAARGTQELPRWPARLRIRPMVDNPGIYEMTWSFAGPDGRATFDVITIDGEPGIRWRRIGSHDIYREP